MAVTECTVIDTLQVLDPQGTTVDAAGDRPLEDGIAPLTVGLQYVDVTFLSSHPEGYNYDELVVVNVTDNPPIGIGVVQIVYEDADGFRVMFNAPPDSEFYSLRWRITV